MGLTSKLRWVFGERGYLLEGQIEENSNHKVYLFYSGKLNQQVRVAEYKVNDKNHKQMVNWMFLNHPNILKLHDYFVHKRRAYFVYENCAKNLASRYFVVHRVRPGKSREPLAKRWTQQSLRALKHCNDLDLCLHDFNFGDAWVDDKMDVKIANFDRIHLGAKKRVKTTKETAKYRSPEGLSKRFSIRNSCQCIRPPNYQSPEKSQVWALGASLLELLTGGSIVGENFRLSEDVTKTRRKVIKSNISNLLEMLRKTDLSEEGKDFLAKTMSYNFRDRPTIEEALRHPWFEVVVRQGPLVSSKTEGTPKDERKVVMDFDDQTKVIDPMQLDAETVSYVDVVVSQVEEDDIEEVGRRYSSCSALVLSQRNTDNKIGPRYKSCPDLVDRRSDSCKFLSVSHEDTEKSVIDVSQEKVQMSEGDTWRSTSTCSFSNDVLTQDTSTDIFHEATSEGERFVETDPIKLAKMKHPIAEHRCIEHSDPATTTIEPYIFAETGMSLLDPTPSPDNRSEMSDMEIIFGKPEQERLTDQMPNAADTTESGTLSAEMSVENDRLMTAALLDSGQRSVAWRNTVLSGDGYDNEDEIVVTLPNEGSETDPLLGDRSPRQDQDRYVPSLITIPEGRAVEEYDGRYSPSGDSSSTLRFGTNLAIGILSVIMLAYIIYELYEGFFKKEPKTS